VDVDDDLLLRCARNCGGAYMAWARAAERPALATADLLLADLGLPVSLPPNSGTMLRPLPANGVRSVVDRLGAFFTGPGGGYQLWSIWPTPDLTSEGFRMGRVPMMVREAGGARGSAPPELRVDRAVTPDALAEAGALLGEVFGGGTEGSAVMPPGVAAAESLAVWVGRVDGVPVSTASAYESDGFVGVYAVATAAAARGRGYGEALSWAAIAWRPGLPATLQASSMGRPVYERMGFRAVAEFTVWERPTR
jgi:hypothetical protein